MKTPRQITVEALCQVDRRNAWSNLTLDSLLGKYKLAPRDTAFVGALFYGVLERRITLDACIAKYSKQSVSRLDPAVLQTLRTGVYQLLYMETVPDNAAVNESVEIVKHLRKAQAAGYVNGVLRSFLRDDKAIPLPDKPLSARLSVEYSCPEPLVNLWINSYGEDATQTLLADSIGKPPAYLRVNTTQITPQELASRLSAHDLSAQTDPDLKDCLVLDKGGDLTQLPEFRRGFFHVQDKSSQLCALSLMAEPGMRVLDACSAPGGKAFTIMELMENQGEIVAADLHEHRIRLIDKAAKRLKLNGISTVAMDMREPNPELGEFDRVLCDVPCSGLGVIRRKPEIKYKPLSDYEKLPSVQYKILETTAHYCRAGGRLVYSTCTLNPAENQQVVQRFLDHHPEFAPGTLPSLLGPGHQRTLLGEFGADGFYIAVLERERAGSA